MSVRTPSSRFQHLSPEALCRRHHNLLLALGDSDVTVLIGSERTGSLASDSEKQGVAHATDSDFLYLSGLRTPNSVLVLRKVGQSIERYLFSPERDAQALTWQGPTCDPADSYLLESWQKRPIDTLQEQMKAWRKDSVIAGLAHQKPLFSPLKKRLGSSNSFIDITSCLHRQRMLKEADELACLRHAIDATVSAFKYGIQGLATLSERHESAVTGLLYREIAKHGCLEWAYDPIVAAGKHACILHYTYNRSAIGDDDLVLIDAGARHQGYCADITRTLPSRGRFSSEQREIYDAVHQAQQAVIAAIAPGKTLAELQQTAALSLSQSLIQLGILDTSVDQVMKDKSYRPYYMHGVSHYLGVDTHDVSDVKGKEAAQIPLEAGMVITVEPGLYFSTEGNAKAARYRDIGIRIEDDVLVTEDGCEVLSRDLPSSASEIEAMCSGE